LYHLSYQIVLFLYLSYFSIKKKPGALYTRLSIDCLPPAIISKIIGVPHFIEVNGLCLDEMEMNNLPDIYVKLMKICEEIVYNMSDKIIAVTPGIKENLISLYNISENKIVVVENGANIELFKPMDKTKSKLNIGLNPNKTYICFVGGLAPWHGVDYLIKAAPYVLEHRLDIYFLIVGDGSMKKELVELADNLGIADNFIFVGNVPYDKVPSYINSSDIAVAPFVKERNSKIGLSPLKIYEYLSCSVPVVASDIRGVNELIKNSGGGLIVSPEDSYELANAIIKLLNEKDKRQKMGLSGREYIEKNHSWESVSRKIKSLIICS
jgi:glycosyltransferase involved in cell wall biosynthesis